MIKFDTINYNATKENLKFKVQLKQYFQNLSVSAISRFAYI